MINFRQKVEAPPAVRQNRLEERIDKVGGLERRHLDGFKGAQKWDKTINVGLQEGSAVVQDSAAGGTKESRDCQVE